MPPLSATKYLRDQALSQHSAEELTASLAALASAGVRTTHDLFMQPDLLPGLPHGRTLRDLRQLVAAHHAAPGLTARALLARTPAHTPISSGSPALDALLSGGVHFGEITEVCGLAGSGRTQLLVALSLSHVRSSPRAHTYYAHAAGMPVGRMRGSEEELSRVMAVECRSMEGLLAFLYRYADARELGEAPELLVVDGVRDLAVAELRRAGEADFAVDALRRALRRIAAAKAPTAVVVVNGVRGGQETEPALGFPWSQVAHVRLLLQRMPGVEARTLATLLRATGRMAQQTAEFVFVQGR
ncbi:DNA repair protein rad51d [Coemansia interrupta]|uniref:DNA repair protein rad51d n=1 Tax=Coemansia interrupta TaxID=1126814 RepID=A0A9W8H8N6_9FUNG|nr:DNA repair protein rad51d [Coemansia interrupta]